MLRDQHGRLVSIAISLPDYSQPPVAERDLVALVPRRHGGLQRLRLGGVPSLLSSVYAKAHSFLASAGSSGVPSGRSSLKVNTTYRDGVTTQAGSSSL